MLSDRDDPKESCDTGKSTFWNALLGLQLLPSSNFSETARIVCLEHTSLQPGEFPSMSYTEGGEILAITGENAIRKLPSNHDTSNSAHHTHMQRVQNLEFSYVATYV
jgi:hypothetical protein